MSFEEVSYREVLNVLEKRLEKRLKKASMYPELLNACLPTARDIRALNILRSKGAELRLIGPINQLSRSIHAIERKYLPLYNVCRRLSLNTYHLDGINYASTRILYKGSHVGVYLGERYPLIRFSTDPLILTRQEFLSIYNRIRRYCKAIGYPLEDVKDVERYDEFIMRSYDASLPNIRLRTILDIEDFAEKYDVISVATSEEGLTDDEVLWIQKLERLAEAGTKLHQSSPHGYGFRAVYKVDACSVERLTGLPVADIAESVWLIKSTYNLFTRRSIGISTPIGYLHASRLLEERGVPTVLVELSWRMKLQGVRPPRPLGIQVYEIYADGLGYCIVIFPRRLKMLPPIRTAKVIRTPRKIMLVNP
jgi:hypothetical protein